MCRHLNCSITEETPCYTTHYYRNGVLDYHNNEPGQILMSIFVECPDCGMSRMYHVGRLPRWLQRLYETGFGGDEIVS